MAWILLRPSNYKQVAPLVRTGGSRHTGLAALPHRNIQIIGGFEINKIDSFQYFVEKLGALFFVHNTVHIFLTKHSRIFLCQSEFFFRHLIFP